MYSRIPICRSVLFMPYVYFDFFMFTSVIIFMFVYRVHVYISNLRSWIVCVYIHTYMCMYVHGYIYICICMRIYECLNILAYLRMKRPRVQRALFPRPRPGISARTTSRTWPRGGSGPRSRGAPRNGRAQQYGSLNIVEATSTCICIWIYACTYIYVHVCICIYLYIYVHKYTYIEEFIHICRYVYACVYIGYTCLHMLMYICTFVHRCVEVYTHTHAQEHVHLHWLFFKLLLAMRGLCLMLGSERK